MDFKLLAATGNVLIDVAFWGGIIPGNQAIFNYFCLSCITIILFSQNELVPLLQHGVRGFKCFLCPSGVDEFPQVQEDDLEIAFQRLQNTSATILVFMF